jgi:hypothetical protein
MNHDPIINRINETKASFEELEKLRAHAEGRHPHNTYIGASFYITIAWLPFIPSHAML